MRLGTPAAAAAPPRPLRDAVVAALVARTALAGGVRVVYPFLPEIARGLRVSLATLGALVALRSLAGLAAPVTARIVETTGRRTLMLAGITLATCGSALAALTPAGGGAATVVVAGAAFLLVGLGKPTCDLPMQAWFAARVPYEQRGRVLGTTELSWALGLLVTVPLGGVLIARFGWRAGFILAAAYGVVGLAAVVRLIASDRPATRERRPLRLTRARIALLGVVLAYSVAAEAMFIVYGAWLEQALGLQVAAIGLFTLVVVGAELAGEGAVAAVGDRVGLQRMILAGLLLSAVAYVGVGFVGGSLVLAVLAVVVWFVGFEVSIVATMPFATEVASESRERLLSLVVVTIALSRAVGAVVGPQLYATGGIRATGLFAAVLVLGGAALLRVAPRPGLAAAG